MFIFEWLILAVIGAVIGVGYSFITQNTHMPQSLCVAIGTIGSLVGGALFQVTQVSLFGAWSFYLSGVMVALGLLFGGTLVYTLTSTEKRV